MFSERKVLASERRIIVRGRAGVRTTEKRPGDYIQVGDKFVKVTETPA